MGCSSEGFTCGTFRVVTKRLSSAYTTGAADRFAIAPAGTCQARDAGAVAEVDPLRRSNKKKGRLRPIDLTTPSTEPASNPEIDRLTVERFQQNHDDAVREVYRFYSGSVGAVVASIISDRETVGDVVQQTFLKAWQNADRFDPDRPMGPWIRTIARRTAIDALRSAQRRPAVALSSVAEPAGSPVVFEAAWVAGEVRAALGRLPDDERVVIKLSHLEGLSHPEIADRLAIPVGTVKSRSHRAHRRLASYLRHLQDEPAGATT